MNERDDTLAELEQLAQLVDKHAGELRRMVADARNRRGLTLRAIADATGRSVETVRTWSRGDD